MSILNEARPVEQWQHPLLLKLNIPSLNIKAKLNPQSHRPLGHNKTITSMTVMTKTPLIKFHRRFYQTVWEPIPRRALHRLFMSENGFSFVRRIKL